MNRAVRSRLTLTVLAGALALSSLLHTSATAAGTGTCPLPQPPPSPPKPMVTSVFPQQGPISGGTVVTIKGLFFTNACAVKFGTTTAPSFHVVTDAQITATSSPGFQVVDVTVVTPSGISSVNPPYDLFAYVFAPMVTGVSPTAGPAGGGTLVTISGGAFTGATAVTFGATAATSFSVKSDTQVTAISPPGSGTVDVTVTTPAGTSPANPPADQFTYVQPAPPPTVTALNPSTGAAAGGTSVTISGSGFSGVTAVAFGTSASAGFTVSSTSQITATSPPGSGTVHVTVTTPNGTSATSSADQFTYVASVPGAPTNVVAVASDASAAVSWSAPASGGSAITSYTVAASPGGMTATASGTTTAATVPGLTNGITYTFTVTATNATGTGPASAPSNPVTPGRGSYHPLPPARILDTRDGTGGVPIAPLQPGGSVNAQITGQDGVPTTGVADVVLNVTVTNTTASGYLTVYPAGVPRPLASNLNWAAGETVPNLVQVAVGAGGQVTVFNSAGSTDVIFDVAGYVSTAAPVGPAGLYTPLVPARILDTRNGTGGFSSPVGAGQTIDVLVNPPVPSTGVAAVVLNVTVTNPTTASYLTVFPSGSARPTASNLNFVAGQTVPNRVIVQVGSGKVSFFNFQGSVDVVADVGGWFSDGSNPAPGAAFVGMTPTRILDTRGQTGPVGPGATMTVPVAGRGGVPSLTAASPPKAVVLNVTVTDTTAASYLTVYPSDATRPLASDPNWTAGTTVPNLVVVKLGTDGKIAIFNLGGSTDVVVDVVGWYS